MYQWRAGSAAFNAAGSWDNFTTGDSPALTPPGAGDDAGMSGGGTVSGNGDVDTLTVFDDFTFTGSVTAESSLSLSEGTVGIAGGTLTGTMAVSIYGGTVNITKGGMLASNTSSASAGAVLDYGTITVNDGTLQAYSVGDGGAIMLGSGQVKTTLLAVGSNPGTPTTLDIGAGGTVSDQSGEIGLLAGDQSAVGVHSGGVWTSQGNVVLGLGGSASLDIAGGSVSILGSGADGGMTSLLAGFGSGGVGVITAEGGGRLGVTGNAQIGLSGGSGTVSLSAGASMDVSGTLSAGTADLAVFGGTLTIGQGLTMSEQAATLDIENGGTVAGPTGTAQISIDATIEINGGGAQFSGTTLMATNTLTVQGGTLAMNDVLLGSTGGASVHSYLQSDGLLNTAITEIGAQSGDKVILDVQSGATLKAGFQLLLGNGGSGGLSVDGGDVAVNGGISEGMRRSTSGCSMRPPPAPSRWTPAAR